MHLKNVLVERKIGEFILSIFFYIRYFLNHFNKNVDVALNQLRLTKSRFTSALSCPTKLYFAGDKSFANQSLYDSFLAALAEGGFQVGELAKCYFPGGVEVETLNEEKAIAETNALLAKDSVVIYEAAIRYHNCFIRADILVKQGNKLYLHEVKAKSFDSSEPLPFLKKRTGKPTSGWKKYLYDVAFQKWVIQKAFPSFTVFAHLMLIDKSKTTVRSGLNQKFLITADSSSRRTTVVTGALSPEEISNPILSSVNVDLICSDLYTSTYHGLGVNESFEQMVNRFSESCKNHTFINHPVSAECKTCEFKANKEQASQGLKDGRHFCFKEKLGLDATIFDSPTVLDLWNFKRKPVLLDAGIIRLADVTEDFMKFKDVDDGLSVSDRQWLQIEKVKTNDDSVYVDEVGLSAEIASWNFPLHFIDFETTMVAIPFEAGRHPYEGIAFQFSHHQVEEDGSIKHADEFLLADQGVFPNYEFVRSLKTALTKDCGTVFKYSAHENTFLNHIKEQLDADQTPPADKDDLVAFIKSITHSKDDAVDKWRGPRDMVDLCAVIKKYFYDPRTNGSISIKAVLPAILSRSEYLRAKYSKPIYGSLDGIPSKNFTDWTWFEFNAEGQLIDPYDRLPKMFQNVDEEQIELLTDSDTLKNGGAALMAYARMQFDEMSDFERKELAEALLRYCELDTLAMVMIYEYFVNELIGVKK